MIEGASAVDATKPKEGTPLRAIAGRKRATAARLEQRAAAFRQEADEYDRAAERQESPSRRLMRGQAKAKAAKGERRRSA